MNVNVTPDLVSQHFSRIGKLGAQGNTRSNRVRAGHARSAQMLRRMAEKAQKAGDDVQAADLIKRAVKQERLAK